MGAVHPLVASFEAIHENRLKTEAAPRQSELGSEGQPPVPASFPRFLGER